jgi:hypothetical protein
MPGEETTVATLEKPADVLDARAAVAEAKEFAAKLFAGEKISHLGLEEIELTDDGKWWLVTLGFSRPWDLPRRTTTSSAVGAALEELRGERLPDREYKVFRVDAGTGVVAAVKMHDSE